jgi:hypothetical protein
MPKVESEYASFGVVVDAPDKPEPEPAPPPRKLKRPDIAKKFGWSDESCIDLAIAKFGLPRANGLESGWVGDHQPWWFEDKIDDWWRVLQSDLRTLRIVK